jgi:hypothetical protein
LKVFDYTSTPLLYWQTNLISKVLRHLFSRKSCRHHTECAQTSRKHLV